MNNTDTKTDHKHLTRYSREKTSFDGWRVCISKRGHMFTKYMSDREFGGEQGSYEAAKALRNEILARLQESPAHEVIAEFKAKYEKKTLPR